MRFFSGILGLSLAIEASASFHKDVVSGHNNLRSADLSARLLNSAVKVYDSRNLEGQQQNNNGENQYSFDGYSLKYAKCQPIQHFSENAVLSGEYSPMVTDDIVLLRLCPSSSCSSSSEYGCQYNYAEYAIRITDYVRIMLEMKQEKTQALCEFCLECMQGGDNQRKLEDENQEQGNADEAAQQDENEYQENQVCSYWDSYCSNYDDTCDQQSYNDGNADDNSEEYQYSQNGMVDYEQIAELIDCGQVTYNEYAYFVRPTCDATSGQIKMAVYYDNYCIQYAGKEVNVKSLGLGLQEGFFKDMYPQDCMACTDDEYLPYEDNTAGLLCNELYQESAMCTQNLIYDIFEDNNDHSVECKFIEDINFGKYDKYGIIGGGTAWASWTHQVTTSQRGMIIATSCLCIFLIFYACYLHHSMANLLIKSLSHRELLPPKSGRSRRRAKTPRSEKGADDWD